MNDPLLMRVTLSMVAGWWSISLPTLSPAVRGEGWKLKGEAFQEINARIQSGEITENVIAGIAHLANSAVSATPLVRRLSGTRPKL
jgi:hypothetical protein